MLKSLFQNFKKKRPSIINIVYGRGFNENKSEISKPLMELDTSNNSSKIANNLDSEIDKLFSKYISENYEVQPRYLEDALNSINNNKLERLKSTATPSIKLKSFENQKITLEDKILTRTNVSKPKFKDYFSDLLPSFNLKTAASALTILGLTSLGSYALGTFKDINSIDKSPNIFEEYASNSVLKQIDFETKINNEINNEKTQSPERGWVGIDYSTPKLGGDSKKDLSVKLDTNLHEGTTVRLSHHNRFGEFVEYNSVANKSGEVKFDIDKKSLNSIVISRTAKLEAYSILNNKYENSSSENLALVNSQERKMNNSSTKKPNSNLEIIIGEGIIYENKNGTHKYEVPIIGKDSEDAEITLVPNYNDIGYVNVGHAKNGIVSFDITDISSISDMGIVARNRTTNNDGIVPLDKYSNEVDGIKRVASVKVAPVSTYVPYSGVVEELISHNKTYTIESTSNSLEGIVNSYIGPIKKEQIQYFIDNLEGKNNNFFWTKESGSKFNIGEKYISNQSSRIDDVENNIEILSSMYGKDAVSKLTSPMYEVIKNKSGVVKNNLQDKLAKIMYV
ncbi:MAG: hypothetical protein PF569_02685 [Candidatus Woesearchaeota archaeon]|jgi:hypothetical protein|nr:hypothetical protein [Candidatus Woesearchaeota archaeon]